MSALNKGEKDSCMYTYNKLLCLMVHVPALGSKSNYNYLHGMIVVKKKRVISTSSRLLQLQICKLVSLA